MNEEQAKATAEAVSLIFTSTLSRLDKLNTTLATMVELQQQRLDEQRQGNEKMLKAFSELDKYFKPPSFTTPVVRCSATAETFHGIQCEASAGHAGPHSATIMWTDAPGTSTPQ